jgi:predicted cupin superfamily sugar epimerase
MNLEALNLIEHPEGGRFHEVFRSPKTLSLADGRDRSALTHIYFHLAAGEVSRFHRVEQDEVWNLYQGGPLRLWLIDEADPTPQSIFLSAADLKFCAVIPAGVWQAAEPLHGEALVGCSVAPGFDFDDFSLLEPEHSVTQLLDRYGLERFK